MKKADTHKYYCEQHGEVKIRTGPDQYEHIISVGDVEVRLKALRDNKAEVELYAPIARVLFLVKYRDIMNVYLNGVQNLTHLTYYKYGDSYDVDLGEGAILVFNGKDAAYKYSVVKDRKVVVDIGDWDGAPYVKIRAGGTKWRWGYNKHSCETVLTHLRS